MRTCRRLGSGRAHGEREVPITLLSGYYDDGATYPRVGIYYNNVQTWYNTRVEFTLKRRVKKIRLDSKWRGGNGPTYCVAALYDATILPAGRTIYNNPTGKISSNKAFNWSGWDGRRYFDGNVEFEGSFPPGEYALCIMVTHDTWHGQNIIAANDNPQDGDFVVTATW